MRSDRARCAPGAFRPRRVASITAGYVAAVQALAQVFIAGDVQSWPVREPLASISVGIVNGVPCLDLDYVEDSSAAVDMNLVATGSGRLVEIQGTGEQRSFSREELEALLELGFQGISQLILEQQKTLEEIFADVSAVQAKGSRTPAPARDESSLWGDPKDA